MSGVGSGAVGNGRPLRETIRESAKETLQRWMSGMAVVHSGCGGYSGCSGGCRGDITTEGGGQGEFAMEGCGYHELCKHICDR